MMRNVLVLTRNDLAVSFKNKTVYLMVFIPLFVFFSLTVVDRPGGPAEGAKIGLIRGRTYAAGVLPSLEGARPSFIVSWLADEAEAKKQLRNKTVDAVLLPDGKSPEAAVLLVAKKESLKALAVVEGLSQLQRAAEARESTRWISAVAALEEDKGIQIQTLPIWTLTVVLLVGFLVMPPQVAEEKERKLLLGLLQTPMRELEWYLAKVLNGMILAILSIALLHAAGGFGMGHAPSYLAFLVAGSFCFSSMGILMGFLCRTQASARALGVVVYLPNLLPSALADFSKKLNDVAAFVPSNQFFAPVKAILLDGAVATDFSVQLAALLAVGVVSGGAALLLLKKRWLM